jgi:hypothetical protein
MVFRVLNAFIVGINKLRSSIMFVSIELFDNSSGTGKRLSIHTINTPCDPPVSS